MRYLLPLVLLLLTTAIALSALEEVGHGERDSGFVNVELLTLRSVLAGGVDAYASLDALLLDAEPVDRLPDRSVATLIGWIRDEASGLVIAAHVSAPRHGRFRHYVVACGDIARKETLRLRRPCALAGPLPAKAD